MSDDTLPIPVHRIEQAIQLIRGHRVMLDADLAELYGVTTKALNQAVKRNPERFPEDFMFQLSPEELQKWRSQIVTSNPAAKMALRRPPFAFTQESVAMLSSVLRSPRAVLVNVEIMRTFVRFRAWVLTYGAVVRRLDKMERKYDASFKAVFVAIRKLVEPQSKPRRRVGFIRPPEDK